MNFDPVGNRLFDRFGGRLLRKPSSWSGPDPIRPAAPLRAAARPLQARRTRCGVAQAGPAGMRWGGVNRVTAERARRVGAGRGVYRVLAPVRLMWPFKGPE